MNKLLFATILLLSAVSVARAEEFSYWWSAAQKFQWSINYGKQYERANNCVVSKSGYNGGIPKAIGWARESDITDYIEKHCSSLAVQPKQQVVQVRMKQPPANHEATTPANVLAASPASDDFPWPNPSVVMFAPLNQQANNNDFKSRWSAIFPNK